MGADRVRIAGGRLRGRELAVPRGVRPTEGRVREALFSIWTARLPGAALLDLFAGSGCVGFEALGRGASRVVLVEGGRRAAAAIAASGRRLGIGGWRLRTARLPAALERLASEDPFDLVFADPPYRFTAWRRLLAAIGPLLAADGELAVEHSARVELPSRQGSLERTAERRYGETALSFYRHRRGGASGDEPDSATPARDDGSDLRSGGGN